MISAFICMNVKHEKIHEVAQNLVDKKEVREIYSVPGKYDLIAIVKVAENEDLENFVTEHLLKTASIQRTKTVMAFRVYSEYDSEHMFSIGMGSEAKID